MDFDHSDLLEEENCLLLEPKDTKKPRKFQMYGKVHG